MKKTHKQFVVLIILVVASAVLSACNTGSTATPTQNAAPTTNAATATTEVSMPSVNSGAGDKATEPAPQPDLSPTNGQSTSNDAKPIPAGGIERIELTTSDNLKLAGTFYAPQQAKSPAVLMLHMVGGQRGDWDGLARELQSKGFGVVTIDFRGNGGSDGPLDWAKASEDVATAFVWLKGRAEVEPTKLGIVGASIGANLALNFAANNSDAKTVVLLSPGLDYQGIKTEEAMKLYGNRPVLMLASKEDAEANTAVVALDKLATGQHTMQLYENQGHGTAMLGRNNGIENVITEWLTTTTKN